MASKPAQGTNIGKVLTIIKNYIIIAITNAATCISNYLVRRIQILKLFISIFLCTFLDILSQLPGYSFVVSRSLGQLYISSFRRMISIRIVFDWYSIVVRLVFDCRSACVRLPFGLCPIVVQLMFYNAFSIHFEHHDNVMSQSLLSNEGVRMFDFCYLTCVCACVRNASRFSSYKVK